ncbi:MAG TPA: hypothetical protein VD926_00810 [Acidimicrobiales bacterium]|nr:hypothetical protein [Acidimicrobiales bacterium]
MGEAEDRAGEAVAHLQTAGRELIAAARAFLDVVEEVVEDPKAGEAVLGGLADLARWVVPRPLHDDGHGEGDGGVEHIHVD